MYIVRYYADIKFDDIRYIIKIDEWCRQRFKEGTWDTRGVYMHSETKKKYTRFQFKYRRDCAEFKLIWL